jgi:hypothetical protein
VTTDEIFFGVGLILVLAVGSQVLAGRLRIPALIILLPAGFIAGALTSDVNPERLLGAAFHPLVSLAVAVILYDAGLALHSAGLDVLMWAGSAGQRDLIKQAGLELAPGELLASATSEGAEVEGITVGLLLTDEDDFNASPRPSWRATPRPASTAWLPAIRPTAS